MVGKVFISYRRDESAGHAGRVHDRLERELGRDLLFMDVDAIPLGANFAKVIGEEVAKCDALLAIIGPSWIDARDEGGRRRLDDPNDFVRLEIAIALKRMIPVIPVILEGARVPRQDQLPSDLKELALCNGLDVRHASFHADMDKLIRGLKVRKSQQPPTPLGAIVIDVSPNGRSKTRAFVPGNGRAEWFTDHPHGPEMVVVPAGSFMMGSPDNERERHRYEGPQHNVLISQPFAVGRHAITRGQFAAFVNNTNYKAKGAYAWTGRKWKHDPNASWRKPGFKQDDSHPVVCVNWVDANAYATWLSAATGREYRLLTEAEWEYVARAGTATPFWWGASITPAQANYDGNYRYAGGGSKGEWRKAPVPVNSFEANSWGLFNVHGNVWDWCQDVWHDNYNGAPNDGSAWLQGGDATRRVVRGGSWGNLPQGVRSAYRLGSPSGDRDIYQGFRLARTLVP